MLFTILDRRLETKHEIKQNRFSYGMFCSWFFAIFYQKTSKFGFRFGGWVLAIKFRHLRDFLEIVRQLVSQLTHSLSGDNNLVPFHLRWREIVQKVKKSLNVLSNIVAACANTCFFISMTFISIYRLRFGDFLSIC